MKKYLFGLGAMVVGAGLMFVLMHGEVSAGTKAPSKEIHCELFKGKEMFVSNHRTDRETRYHYYCKIKDLTCVTTLKGTSCVKN